MRNLLDSIVLALSPGHYPEGPTVKERMCMKCTGLRSDVDVTV